MAHQVHPAAVRASPGTILGHLLAPVALVLGLVIGISLLIKVADVVWVHAGTALSITAGVIVLALAAVRLSRHRMRVRRDRP